MTWTWAEPFAGAAACSLRLMGGDRLLPPVAWMGGKRRYARAILDAMGVPTGRPSRVLLADAGPWGWVWPLLLDTTSVCEVAAMLRSWSKEHPRDLWQRLASVPPAENVHERAAQWLWLQARSASGVPIWWDGWRLTVGSGKTPADRGEDLRWPGHQAQREAWLSSNGSGREGKAGARAVGGRWEKGNEGRVQDATNGQRGWEMGRTGGREGGQPAWQKDAPGSWRFDKRPGDVATDRPAGQAGQWKMGEELKKARRGDRTLSTRGESGGRTGGMVNPRTIAARIEAIARAFARASATVHHGSAHELIEHIPAAFALRCGLFAYLDPPYVGATGYGWDMPRADVLALARRWADAGAVVAVSEAEPLELKGWHHVDLTRPGCKPEWLTLSRPPVIAPARQSTLFTEVE